MPSSDGTTLATQRLTRTPGRRTPRPPRDSSPHSIHTSLPPRHWLTGARHGTRWHSSNFAAIPASCFKRTSAMRSNLVDLFRCNVQESCKMVYKGKGEHYCGLLPTVTTRLPHPLRERDECMAETIKIQKNSVKNVNKKELISEVTI
ncbi:hypothetical protein DICVIV_14309 [Dictyocaulus viviparus]|uniref:Uncharacterized protein n=1 Tax=Dictyocaulus viviparus TaxID=29172 RepID=A0A0D8X7P7_DICVI|nr:hypothetical protein DICVIV_14309 [Dictyocaulus viviparus]